MYEFQERENRTGIPDRMKAQFEQGSGFLMDDVRVHYNSLLPQRAGAYAYTQGNQVYLGPGQERHLGHELGHVVQQKQGVVKPTSMINGMPLNDDTGLEKKADHMAGIWGNAAIQAKSRQGERSISLENNSFDTKTIQRKVGFEFQVMNKEKKILELDGEKCGHGIELKKEKGYKVTADMGDYEYVTDAVDERKDEGITQLENACRDMDDKHENVRDGLKEVKNVEEVINQSGLDEATKNDCRQEAKQLPGKGYKLYSVRDGIFWIKGLDGEVTAHPQATVGIKIDRLGTFVEKYIEEAKKDPRKPGNSKPMSYLSNGGSKMELKEEQDKLLISTLLHQNRYKEEANVTDAESGFLSLLAIMIQGFYRYYNKERKSPWNAKSAMPLMPRTSLNDAFLKLPQEARERIKNIRQNCKKRKITPTLQFINRIPSARQINNKINTEDYNFANVLKIIIAAERIDEKGRIHKIVTLEQWLQELTDNPIKDFDILAREFCSVSELYGEESGSNKLYYRMKRSTDIGYDETNESGMPKTVEGMLIEIRNMQRGVPIEEWKNVVREVATWTRLVNTEKSPEAAQQVKKSQNPARIVKPTIGGARVTVNRATGGGVTVSGAAGSRVTVNQVAPSRFIGHQPGTMMLHSVILGQNPINPSERLPQLSNPWSRSRQ